MRMADVLVGKDEVDSETIRAVPQVPANDLLGRPRVFTDEWFLPDWFQSRCEILRLF
jgi:hypothetical protein